MQAIYVPPRLFKYSKLEACVGYWRACLDVGLTPTVAFVSVLVGHGALESGNFQVGCWNNNPGNIKAGAAYAGKYTCIGVNEQLKNPTTKQFEECWFAPEGRLTGNPRKGGKLIGAPLPVPPGDPQTRMRAFDTLDDGLENKILFLMSAPWSAVLVPAQRGDASGFVRAIRARHYFTAYPTIPLTETTPYERDVVSLARTYRPFVEQAAEQVRATGSRRPPALPVPDVPPPALAMRFDHTTLDPETVERIENFHELFFDEEMHKPRGSDREPIA